MYQRIMQLTNMEESSWSDASSPRFVPHADVQLQPHWRESRVLPDERASRIRNSSLLQQTVATDSSRSSPVDPISIEPVISLCQQPQSPRFITQSQQSRELLEFSFQMYPTSHLQRFKEQYEVTEDMLLKQLLIDSVSQIQTLALHQYGNFLFQQLYEYAMFE